MKSSDPKTAPAFKVENKSDDSYEDESDEDDLVVGYSDQSGVELNVLAENKRHTRTCSWKETKLLIIAVTVLNIYDGLLIGDAFGSIGNDAQFTFAAAKNRCIAKCFQNIPKGLAVSVLLYAAGFLPLKSFWYGQLVGAVEPVFGVLGALCAPIRVNFAPSITLLEYAVIFGINAVFFCINPQIGNEKGALIGFMVGFILLICLDLYLYIDVCKRAPQNSFNFF